MRKYVCVKNILIFKVCKIYSIRRAFRNFTVDGKILYSYYVEKTYPSGITDSRLLWQSEIDEYFRPLSDTTGIVKD